MKSNHTEPSSPAGLEIDKTLNSSESCSITLQPEDCDKFTRMIEDGLLAPLYAHETAVQGNFALTLGSVVVVESVDSSTISPNSTE